MAPYGIRVLSIEPGWIRTALIEEPFVQRDFSAGLEKLKYPLSVPVKSVATLKKFVGVQMVGPDFVAQDIFRCVFTSKLPNYHVVVAPLFPKLFYLLLGVLPTSIQQLILSGLP